MAKVVLPLRRRALERVWILGSTAYGVLRIVVANHTVRKYGVNIWGFGVVELATSFVYGLSTARIVGALVDRRRDLVLRWAPVAVATFLAPEAFIILTGRHMPRAIYAIVAALVATMGTIASLSLLREVRIGRAAQRAARREDVSTAP